MLEDMREVLYGVLRKMFKDGWLNGKKGHTTYKKRYIINKSKSEKATNLIYKLVALKVTD